MNWDNKSLHDVCLSLDRLRDEANSLLYALDSCDHQISPPDALAKIRDLGRHLAFAEMAASWAQ